MTITSKVTAYEKMLYAQIAKSHNISLSEWIASILSIYQDGYGELEINSQREKELLSKNASLEREVKHLKRLNDMKKAIKKHPPTMP